MEKKENGKGKVHRKAMYLRQDNPVEMKMYDMMIVLVRERRYKGYQDIMMEGLKMVYEKEFGDTQTEEVNDQDVIAALKTIKKYMK